MCYTLVSSVPYVLVVLILAPEHPSLPWEYQHHSHVNGVIATKRALWELAVVDRLVFKAGRNLRATLIYIKSSGSSCCSTSHSLGRQVVSPVILGSFVAHGAAMNVFAAIFMT